MKISEKFKHFSKFSDFCTFQAIDPPKLLINDKDYWCFLQAGGFRGNHDFHQKS